MRPPDIIDDSGNKYWYKEGTTIYHRLDGPAVEYSDGGRAWFVNGKYHRIDGPAIEYANGIILWYINGLNIDCKTQEEFDRLIRLKAFW